jgi:iron(III) transport system ATP-binding protein
MLSVERLVKRYPAWGRGAEPVLAVDGVSLRIEPGELFTIVGPSGCGKTTTLRCVAGLEQPDEGDIHLGSTPLFSSSQRIRVPTNERGLGMVFQSYALWPHLDVFANVAFPLQVMPRSRRLPRPALHRRVERALAAVRLDDVAHRPSTDLSGGQQQRVALARALVTEPALLLLDEPLSNIDAKLREEMRSELMALQKDLGITTLYVTHDQVEALALSDSMAVMRDGRVEQVGTPREVYDQPASLFVAGFIGASNLLRGTVVACDGGTARLATPMGELVVDAAALVVGEEAVAAVRPEQVTLLERPAGGTTAASNEWAGTVRTTVFLGDALEHSVLVGPSEIRVRTDVGQGFPPGAPVLVCVPNRCCRAFPASSSGAGQDAV